MTNWGWIIVWIFIALLFVFIFGLISYFFSKSIVKWIKRVKRIDERKDLEQYPKLAKIVRMIKVICRHYNMKIPEIGVYPAREINAFAIGRINDNLIAFSTGSINNLTEKEIGGVIAHEMSHLIKHDFAWILVVQGFFDFLHLLLTNAFFYLLISRSKKNSEKKSLGESLITIIFYHMIYRLISLILRILTLLPVFWFNRKRELGADRKGAKIIGIDNMIITLKKILVLENQGWIVNGLDLTEDTVNFPSFRFKSEEKKANDENPDPNSLILLKFNPSKKKSDWLLELFRTHPSLEKRIAELEKLKRTRGNF